MVEDIKQSMEIIAHEVHTKQDDSDKLKPSDVKLMINGAIEK